MLQFLATSFAFVVSAEVLVTVYSHWIAAGITWLIRKLRTTLHTQQVAALIDVSYYWWEPWHLSYLGSCE